MSIKDYLRSELKARRREYITQLSVPEMSLLEQELSRKVLSLPLFNPRPQAVGCYYAITDEVPTAGLISTLWERDIQVCLPCVHPDLSMSFRAYNQGTKLETSSLKIPQPPKTSPSVSPDVIIVPMLGFNADGHRIGYGLGYYDRALMAARSVNSMIAVGLAFDCQEVSEDFAEEFDEQLDWIITQSRVIEWKT